MACWKRWNYGLRRKGVVARDWGDREGWLGRAHRIFRAVQTLLWYNNNGYMPLYIVKTCRIFCTKWTLTCTVDFGWLCQCRFISCDTCISLMGDGSDGGSWWWGRVKIIEEKQSIERVFFFSLKYFLTASELNRFLSMSKHLF